MPKVSINPYSRSKRTQLRIKYGQFILICTLYLYINPNLKSRHGGTKSQVNPNLQIQKNSQVNMQPKIKIADFLGTLRRAPTTIFIVIFCLGCHGPHRDRFVHYIYSRLFYFFLHRKSLFVISVYPSLINRIIQKIIHAKKKRNTHIFVTVELIFNKISFPVITSNEIFTKKNNMKKKIKGPIK